MGVSALDEPIPAASSPWQLLVADWRRRIAALYDAVRACAAAEQGWRLWSETRHELYARHPASPIPAADRGRVAVELFAYDPALRVLATIEPCAPIHMDVPCSTGPMNAFDRFGRARFVLGGAEQTLDLLWLTSYGNGIFLPFADATNRRTTYGGGRYLLDSVKGADLGMEQDRLVLDFNFAFAPSCAWDERWSCPLAPAGNRLPVAIEGGERAPRSMLK